MQVLSVTEFLSGINEVLSGVPALVEGEVSGYSVSQGKWAFFSLKDDESVVSCFMPAWKLKHEMEDGMLVRLAGVPRVYEKSGRFSINVEALEPSGEGSLKRAFELLCKKLETEGLFAPERKRELPRFPERIGLVASVDSAAYSDFIRILQNRWGGVEVLVQDVRVQGEDAVRDICEAIENFSQLVSLRGVQRATRQSGTQADGIAALASLARNDRVAPDIIVLTRGGGSLEDLQAFNSEEVARAMYASAVPVVVGVGHERDVSIADLVADVRASTPSNAAERVVPDRRDVSNEVRSMVLRSANALDQRIRSRQHAMERFLAVGVAFIRGRHGQLRQACGSLDLRLKRMLERCRDHTNAAGRLLESVNPQRVLLRGYSIATRGGRIVRSTSDLNVGDKIVSRFAHGSATSTVTQTSRE
ncbi:MAG: exodeoxyribonuclease VII large subunit [Candidatus Uhrbacteria bacterium]